MSNKKDFVEIIKQQLETMELESNPEEIGIVLSAGDGVVKAYGLSNIAFGEVVEFESGIRGICFSLEEDYVGIIVLGDVFDISSGSKVKRAHEQFVVPVGKEILGRVLDGVGRYIDGQEIVSEHSMPVEVKAPGIISRRSVHEPLQTGIKAIDALTPIGRGQRELVIGDRQTGKTSVIIDTIIAQKSINDKAKTDSEKMFCIYVAIGQKMSSVVKIASVLKKYGAMEYTCIVSASASDPAAVQYIAPYVGCAIGEYFRDNGMHAVVFYDDLSKQAAAYRQISLLLRRPPGREAYPGDVFYLHSRLLERAAKLNDDLGGGSLTAIPVVETQANDISAYIPTNVISITDGQLFLESDLFFQGIRPAINVGNSVSRVGGAAQTKAIKKVTGSIKLELAQYREVVKFSQFASEVDSYTKKLIERGKRWTEILKQPLYAPLTLEEQVISLYAVGQGFLDDVSVVDIQRYEKSLHDVAKTEISEVMSNIRETGDFSKEDMSVTKEFLIKFTKQFV